MLGNKADKVIVLIRSYLWLKSMLECFYFRQLNNVGRSVFKENIYLQRALSYHMKETEALQKNSQRLQKNQSFLLQEKVPSFT